MLNVSLHLHRCGPAAGRTIKQTIKLGRPAANLLFSRCATRQIHGVPEKEKTLNQPRRGRCHRGQLAHTARLLLQGTHPDSLAMDHGKAAKQPVAKKLDRREEYVGTLRERQAM